MSTANVVGPVVLADVPAVKTAIQSLVVSSADSVKLHHYVKGENIYFFTISP